MLIKIKLLQLKSLRHIKKINTIIFIKSKINLVLFK